jgi:6-phosphogluconolactonase
LLKIGITRREFISRTAATLAVPFATSAVRAAAASASAGSLYAYVGTYTPNGGGIYLFSIDRASGALMQLQVVDDTRNPSWLAVNPTQTRLYAVSEIDSFQGARTGAVVSYAIDGDSFELKRLGAVASGGAGPSYVSVHPTGKYVFAANYGGGSVAVFPVGPDGILGEACDVRPSVGPRHHPHAIDDRPRPDRPVRHRQRCRPRSDAHMAARHAERAIIALGHAGDRGAVGFRPAAFRVPS